MVAISFDVWAAFLEQPSAASTLGDRINDELNDLSWPVDAAVLHGRLETVRGLIAAASVPTATLDALVDALGASALGATDRVRLRPSSNTSALDAFNAASLYATVDACLADDLDSDSSGPSLCDASSAAERGVGVALVELFASFYSDRAVIERWRRGLDDDSVLGLGALVDAAVAAPQVGGRTDLRVTPFSVSGRMVSQPGAHIDDPLRTAAPEDVDLYIDGANIYPTLLAFSPLLGEGVYALDYTADYEALGLAFAAVYNHYTTLSGEGSGYRLLFSFLKQDDALTIDGLMIRRTPGTASYQQGFLFDNGRALCVFQGEAADLFANHRLKTRWQLPFRTVPVRADALGTSPFDVSSTLQWVEAGQVQERVGVPTSWPGAAFRFDPNVQGGYPAIEQDFAYGPSDGWGATLGVHAATELSTTQMPLQTFDSTFVTLQVTYPEGQLSRDWEGNAVLVTEEVAILEACRDEPLPGNARLHEVLVEQGDVSIAISMYYPPDPGATAGYTAPLQQRNQTEITGLTTEPLVLTSWWSQTFRPHHHNISEDFLFEPRLDPNVTQAQLDELQAADIRWIVAYGDYEDGRISVVGADNTFREVDAP